MFIFDLSAYTTVLKYNVSRIICTISQISPRFKSQLVYERIQKNMSNSISINVVVTTLFLEIDSAQQPQLPPLGPSIHSMTIPPPYFSLYYPNRTRPDPPNKLNSMVLYIQSSSIFESSTSHSIRDFMPKNDLCASILRQQHGYIDILPSPFKDRIFVRYSDYCLNFENSVVTVGSCFKIRLVMLRKTLKTVRASSVFVRETSAVSKVA